MNTAEKYLRPEVIRTVARLDLRARFIVEGFLSGLHASPFHGFSVEFSEHRRYNPGDDVKDLDWTVYAKTERYYVKKFQAETNVTGYLVMDLSASMNYHGRDAAARARVKVNLDARGRTAPTADAPPADVAGLTKFEYGICLAAALGYLMIHQQDPVGLIAFDTAVRTSLPPRSKRTQLGAILSVLANLTPSGQTDVAACLHRVAAMVRGKSLVMIFSDLLTEPEPVIRALHHLRHRGNEVILFHILDECEAKFPYEDVIDFHDVESADVLPAIDAGRMAEDYLAALAEFRSHYQSECSKCGVDFVPIDTGMGFDTALLEYLIQRQRRF